MFSLSQPLAHLAAKFILEGETYEVESFHVNFDQATDFKGQPQQEKIGGKMMIGLTQSVSDNIYEWASRPAQLKSGQVVFQTESTQTVLRIEFRNAYCVQLIRSINNGEGNSSIITVSPEALTINGIPHDNNWNY